MKINSTTLLRFVQSEAAKRVQSDRTTTDWWTGGKNSAGRWVWPDGTPIDTGLGLWMSGQPNNAISPGCAELSQVDSGISLRVASCSGERGYICERPLSAPAYCDTDNGWESHSGNCFKFFDYRKQWRDAKMACENQGAVLARPLTDQDQTTVYDMAVHFKRDTWIGLNSVIQSGNAVWQWANGTNLATKTYWKTQPSITVSGGLANNSCVVEHPGNAKMTGWKVESCDQERQYICQRPEAMCAPGWKAFGTMCYQFDPRFVVNWNTAKSYCENLGGAMLEITSGDIQSFVNRNLQELHEVGLSYIWIGASGTRGRYTWNSGASMTYRNFYGSTSTSSSYKRCAYISTTNTRGQWTVTSYCTQSRGVACQIPSTVAVQDVTTPTPKYVCERGWMNSNYRMENHCFKMNTTALLTWGEAVKACSDLGGNLAMIKDSSTQSYLGRYIRGSMWIGLSDQAKEGTFTWVDNSQVDYNYWYGHDVTKINTEDKDCVISSYNSVARGAWKPSQCSDRNGFICQKHALNGVTPTGSAATTPIPWSVNCGPFWEELSSSGACFQFHEEQLTYADAQSYCSRNGGNLASIVSVGEQNYIAGRISGMSSVALWIGANDLNAEGGWAWQDRSPLTYINWTPGEPNNGENNEDCVTIFSSKATWNDINCNNRNGFICKRTSRVTPAPSSTLPPPTAPANMFLGCPAGWLGFNRQCYVIKHETKRWKEAQAVCRQSGGDLASITTVGEQDFIYSQARSVAGPLWIGLSSMRTNRYYQWSDGRKATYTHWSRDEPNNSIGGNQKCVTFNALGAGYWSDEACDLASVTGYVCKRPQQAMSVTVQQDYKKGCPSNGVGYYSNCYLFFETKMTFTDAEKFCVNKGGHLITVLDRFIQAFLTSELTERSGMYWIGLQTYTTGYRYYYWTSKKRVLFTNFDQAHTGREISSCVAVNTAKPAGLWHNFKCTVEQPFICETSRVGFTLPPPGQQTTLSNRCPYYYTDYNGYCYRVVSTSYRYAKPWTAARDYCRLQGGDLLTVHNSTEAAALRKYVIRYTRGSYWIGLNNIGGSRNTGYKWSDGSGFTYSRWGSGQPDNHNHQENCVEWDLASDRWRDANCFVGKSYVCQIKKGSVAVRTTPSPVTAKPPVTCGAGSRLIHYWRYYNGSCYYFHYQYMSWFQARSYCQNTASGELVSLHSIEEANFINTQIGSLLGSVAWIGLNELGLSGYQWSDGTAVGFVNWNKNEPNDGFGGQKCAVISNTDGFWGDENCAQTYKFVCKQPVGSKTSVSPPTPAPPLKGNCRSGWTGVGNKCYLLKDLFYTYNDSQKYCRRFGKTFDLVSISGPDEQAFVYSLLYGKTNTYWIGLNQMQTRRRFVWLDNSEVKFTNWDYREPNGSSYYPSRQELCVEMRTYDKSAGKWADVKCLQRMGFICQGYKEANQPAQTVPALPSWCKAGYQVYGESCYKMVTDLKSWDDASKMCQKDGAHLVSIGSSFEQAHVQVMTYGQDMNFWTGMTDRKLKGVYRWSDSWPVLYTNWGRGEPSRMTGEGCVALAGNSTWNDTVCDNTYGSICEISHGKPPPHPTPVDGYCPNSTWESNSRYCYYISTRGYSSWPEAQFYCKKMGMRLVTIHNNDDQSFLLQYIGRQTYRTSYYFWVGLVNGNNNGFEWNDKATVSFTNWATNEPSNGRMRSAEECVQMHPTSGKWYDTYCTTRRPYICMADMVFPGQSTNAPPKTDQPPPVTQKPPVTKGPSLQTGGNTGGGKEHTRAGPQGGTTNKPPPKGRSTPPPIGRPTQKPGPLHGTNPPNTSGGGLSGGGVAGIVIGVLLALILVALGLIYARRQGIINVGPNFFPGGGSFENALYKKSGDDHDININ